MTAQNWQEKYLTNPITSNLTGDLLYFARSPYGVTNDAVITWDDFANQFQFSKLNYAVDTGPSTTQFVVSISPAPTAYADGLYIVMKAGNSNDVSPTLKVNSLAAKPIVGQGGAPLSAGDILINSLAILYYNSTLDSFVLQNPQTYSGPLTSGDILVGNASNIAKPVAVTGDISITNSGVVAVNKIKGATLGTTTATNAAILIANGTSWNSQTISGDISLSSAGVTRVTKINTVTLGTTTATSGNLLIADGSQWVTKALSGDATILSTGVISVTKIKTGTVAGNTALLQAYNTNTASYTTFGTLTANNPPTFDLSTSTTIGGAYIYRAGGNVVSLTDGGTNASLTASNGGIVWSNATQLQILAGTATAGRMLQSGSTATPAWSTATYPSIATSTGSFIYADGTNFVASTSLWPNTVGSAGKMIRSDGTTNAYTTSTFADTYAINTLLYASAANTVTGLATANRASLSTDATGVPTWLAMTDGQIIIGSTAGAPAAASLSAGSGISITPGSNAITIAATSGSGSPLTTKGDIYTFSTVNDRLPVAVGDGKILQVNSSASTGLSYSTPTYPSASGTLGKFLISDGTNNVYSTSTIPTSAGATANKILLSDGTNYVLSTPTFPNASASVGKFIRSDGTNWIASTPTLPTSAGTSGKILQSDGTNYVESTPTYPSASGSSGKFIISDGTNNVYSTSTIPTSAGSTAKAILESDGTNYVLGPIVDSNTYTPTLTNVTNVDSSVSAVFQWMRIGSVVNVSGTIQVDATTAGTGFEVGLSLPIASTFTTATQCSGTGGTSGTGNGRIAADTTNNRAKVLITPTVNTNQSYGIIFQYLIV